MITKELETALNKQVAMESFASFSYLAMASWMENEGFEGTAKFLYAQSDEERMHMLKLFHYINEVGGYAIAPSVKAPDIHFESYAQVFDAILKQEEEVSKSIHNLVSLANQQNDHTTFNFLQWYVAEQREEEAQFRSILDKLKILGKDGSGLYLLDRDIASLATAKQVSNPSNGA
jgi:ferritin